MATINGRTSVFITPEPLPQPPVCQTQGDYLQPFTKIAQEIAEDEWLADAIAQAEYQAWCDEFNTGFPTDAEADRMAEFYKLSRLGDAAIPAINGHDLKWQNGGVK